jgi:hypothetical protein
MASIRSQVQEALAENAISDPTDLEIDDLCFVRTHYGQSPFVWALGIVVRAYRERLEASKKIRRSARPKLAGCLSATSTRSF